MGLSAIFSAPSINWGPTQNYMSGQQGIEQNLGQEAGQQQAQYNQFSANNLAALNQYSSYLNQNPGTNTQDAGYIANAEAGASEDAAKAKSNLTEDLAQRGIGPNSSMAVGGLASINQGLASTDASVRANLAQSQIAQHAANVGTLAQLWGGAQNNAFNQASATSNEQSGIEGNLANEATQQALDQYNADLTSEEGGLAGLGTLGSTFADFL